MKNKNHKAAMEMSVGTIVTIVLLMSVLVLGLVMVQSIFGGATQSVDSINEQVRTEINDLFSSDDTDLSVSLGTQHRANVKRGEEAFGFVFGFSPKDPGILRGCSYAIEQDSGKNFCAGVYGIDTTDWFITPVENGNFNEIKSDAGFALAKMSIPEDNPTCLQRFSIKITCTDAAKTYRETWVDINIVKKGIF